MSTPRLINVLSQILGCTFHYLLPLFPSLQTHAPSTIGFLLLKCKLAFSLTTSPHSSTLTKQHKNAISLRLCRARCKEIPHFLPTRHNFLILIAVTLKTSYLNIENNLRKSEPAVDYIPTVTIWRFYCMILRFFVTL